MSINQILTANPLNPFHMYLVYIDLIFCTVSGLSQLLSDSSLQAKNISLTQTTYVSYQDNKISSSVSQIDREGKISV
ncbi:hypothetical protein RINTHH_13020 [Richelia intracellularis HH01]|uniref:Uncharacterized protein n=1 Tax=Richelia intracellularis HH01 TaxID=1165094 RepID=M1WZB9_9NOST|nr:hypothetical protein [Richelia intracellularis]CCH67457.1 hypothetical protein RINTHH_13020 [Richelia intracellularis HH01]